MKFGGIIAAVSAMALVTGPVYAQASQANRAGSASATEESELEGGSGILIALLAAAAIITGIIIAADNEDDDTPASP